MPSSVRGSEQSPSEVTGFLSDLVLATRWKDVPEQIRHETKRALLNYFAVSLAGCADRTVETALRVLAPFSGRGSASVVGRAERFDMLTASMINAIAANVHDFDDTHIPTILHPTAPVLPAISALAQSRTVTGTEFLSAFLVGVEIECRIANAMSPGHYSRGWHITSTCGVFGAAAACGRLLGLDRQQLAWSLGSAAVQACGLVEALGTSSKSLSVGNAARNGLLSALMAGGGFEGPPAPLEGERGFLRVFTDTLAIDQIQARHEWGWELSRNAYKPYPCGVVLNPVIDACLALAPNIDVRTRPDDVAAIEITGHPLLRQRTDRPGVVTGRQSQVSAQHAVGVVLWRQRAGLEEFSDAAVQQDEVRALGARVRFRDEPAMSVDAATVCVRLADGRSFTEEVTAARGSLNRPLSDAELERKLRSLCEYGRSGVDPEPLLEAVWNLEASGDASVLLKMASLPF